MDIDDLSHPLDEDLVLEPVDAEAPVPLLGGEPVVSDVHGRLWRVRRRFALDLARPVPVLGVVGLVLTVLILLALLV
jgi:hypothetical protein